MLSSDPARSSLQKEFYLLFLITLTVYFPFSKKFKKLKKTNIDKVFRIFFKVKKNSPPSIRDPKKNQSFSSCSLFFLKTGPCPQIYQLSWILLTQIFQKMSLLIIQLKKIAIDSIQELCEMQFSAILRKFSSQFCLRIKCVSQFNKVKKKSALMAQVQQYSAYFSVTYTVKPVISILIFFFNFCLNWKKMYFPQSTIIFG